MYTDCRIGNNSTCQRCRANEQATFRRLSNPFSFWHIGAEFQTDPLRCVFIGKNAVGGADDPINDRVSDVTQIGRLLYLEGKLSYFTYTHKIVCRVAGVSTREEAIRRIALTNLIKCNHSTGAERKDTTSDSMRHLCLEEIGVVWKEIALLQPRHIVLYTGVGSYDWNIERFRYGDSFEDKTDKGMKVLIGQKYMGWWHRDFYSNGQLVLRMLRTGHPERKKRDPFVDSIATWLEDGRRLFL